MDDADRPAGRPPKPSQWVIFEEAAGVDQAVWDAAEQTAPKPTPTTAPTEPAGEPTEGGIASAPTEQLPRGNSQDALQRARAAEINSAGNSTAGFSGISTGDNSGGELIPTEQPVKRKRGRPRKEINSAPTTGSELVPSELNRGGRPVPAPQPVAATPARWTVTQKRVWLTETSPNWRFLVLGEKAKRVGISKRQYQRICGEKVFADELVSFWRMSMMDAAANVTQAIVHNALMERGREGYKDRELFMRTTGLLPETRVNVSGKVAQAVTVGLGASVERALTQAREAERTQGVGNRIIDVTPIEGGEG